MMPVRSLINPEQRMRVTLSDRAVFFLMRAHLKTNASIPMTANLFWHQRRPFLPGLVQIGVPAKFTLPPKRQMCAQSAFNCDKAPPLLHQTSRCHCCLCAELGKTLNPAGQCYDIAFRRSAGECQKVALEISTFNGIIRLRHIHYACPRGLIAHSLYPFRRFGRR
jgi:hypothetical protein